MRHTHIFIVLALFLVLIGGCRKESQTFTITGNIYDGGFDKNLQGATVQLLGSKIESGVYNSNYVEMGIATTDAQGNYTIEIPDELVAGYRFYIHSDNYFDIYEDVETQELENTDGYTQNFTLFPEGTIKLKINNTTPYGMDDLIKYRYKNIESACKDCCNNLMQEGEGPMFSIEKECLARGEKWIYLEWSVTKNGYTILDADSIYCQAFNTTTFQINY